VKIGTSSTKLDTFSRHSISPIESNSIEEIFGIGYQELAWENLNGAKIILIDTYNLKEVYPFGREVFYYNFLKIKNQQKRIRFVGPDALQLAPT